MKLSRIRTIGISALQAAILPLSSLTIASLGIYLFGIERWGEFVFIQLLIFPITLACNWGSRNFMIREFSRDPSKIGDIFITNFVNRALILPITLLLFIFIPSETAVICVSIITLHFCYLSYDGPIVFTEKFKKRIIAEVLGTLCFTIGLFQISEFNLNQILIIQLCVVIVKLIYLSFALKQLRLFSSKPSFQFTKTLQSGLPFFAIGLGGWMQSKSDLNVLALMKGTSEIAAYQLLIGGLSLIQAVIGFLIEPLMKFFYRSKEVVTNKIGLFIFKIGFPIVLLGLVALIFILELLAPDSFDVSTYVLGFFYLVPFLFSMPLIFKLYKSNNENRVVYFTFAAAGVNIILTWILVPVYGLNGALLGSAFSQTAFLIILKSAAKFRIKQK